MYVIKILLIVLEVICAFLLIGVILLQKPRSQGAGMAFGAGVGESLFGAQTGNVLTRTTVVLGVIFLVNALILAKVEGLLHGASLMETVPVATAPMTPASPEGMPGALPAGEVEMPAAPAPMNVGDAPVVGVPSPVETLPAAEPVPAPVAPEVAAPAEAAPAPAN